MRAKLLLLLPACALCVLTAFGQTTQPKGPNSKAGRGLDAISNPDSTTTKSAGTQDDRAWWGVKTQSLPLRLEGESPIPAAEVVELKPGGAAARAGLRQGDLIVGTQMRQLTSSADLDRAVAEVPPGGKLALQVIRDGNPMEITLTRGGTSSGGGLAQTIQPRGSPPAPAGTRATPRTGIFINEREITPTEMQRLRAIYGYVAPPGHYWYDPGSGLYGVIGREAAGFMQPGHDFGPLPANASSGTTGVFINGRQINMAEAIYCQKLFGAVYQGRWWLDGRTGNMGAEGSPVPLVNVYTALQQSQRSSQGGGYGWHSNTTGASGGSDGKCSYVSIPGSGSVMTGDCD